MLTRIESYGLEKYGNRTQTQTQARVRVINNGFNCFLSQIKQESASEKVNKMTKKERKKRKRETERTNERKMNPMSLAECAL